MSKEDLIPITTTEQAKRLGSAGGKAKTLAKKMINRKYCNSKCPLFNTCWAKHTSYSLYERAIEKAKEEKWDIDEIKKLKIICALKSLPSQVIEGATRIIQDGEEGFNSEMMEQIMRLKYDIMIGKVTIRNRERYLYQLRETKKSIYGDKSRIEGINKEGLTAEDFAVCYDEHKKQQKEAEEKKNKEVDKNEQ